MNIAEFVLTCICIGGCVFLLYYDWHKSKEFVDERERLFNELHECEKKQAESYEEVRKLIK